jgi:hypothetical protein
MSAKTLFGAIRPKEPKKGANSSFGTSRSNEPKKGV